MDIKDLLPNLVISFSVTKQKITTTKDKCIEKTKSLHSIQVNSLLGYLSVILFGGMMLGMNIFSFLVCLSVKYPELNLQVYLSETKHLATPQYESQINTQFGNQEETNETEKREVSSFQTNEVSSKRINYRAIAILEKIRQSKDKKSAEEQIELNSALDSTESTINEEAQIKEVQQESNNTPPNTQDNQTKNPEETTRSEDMQNTQDTTSQTIVEEISQNDVLIDKKTQDTVNSPRPQETNDPLTLSLNKEIDTALSNLGGDIFKDFTKKVLKSDNMFLEDGIWYTYVYVNYKSFGKGVVPSKTDIVAWGLDYDTTLLMLDPKIGAVFATEYKKVKLISDSILSDITGKRVFLKELVDDKKYVERETDDIFKELKVVTENITNGLSNSQKIAKIYAYVIGNLSYTKNFDVNNREIFSGIESYDSKIGACGGYSKMFFYMLSFAGITDISVVRGHVIDAPDFPNIGHAWVRVGNFYYDPTFDDPIGALKTKTLSDYKYFGLPKDIFYTNRFNQGELPESLKIATLEVRQNYIQKELAQLVDKYESKGYKLLEEAVFRNKYNISYNENITIEGVKSILPYFEVKNSAYTQDGTIMNIADLEYYNVDDTNVAKLLAQLNYNIENYKLLKWEDTYRVAYNIRYQ